MDPLTEERINTEHPIYRAIVDRKIDEVANHFKSGVSVYLASEYLAPIFVFAWDEEDFSMMDLFFDSGYDPNHELNRFQETPLMRAVGNTRLFMHLIERGADPTAKDKYGYSCLHRAAAAGNIETVDFCVSKGVPVNIADKQGTTPLRAASQSEKTEMVRHLLFTHGADLESLSSDGRSILAHAAQSGKLVSVKCLLELGADIEVKDIRGQSAFGWALANGHLEIAELIQCWSEQGEDPKPDNAPS